MDIEIGEWRPLDMSCAAPESVPISSCSDFGTSQNARGALHDEWHVTAELDRVAKTLLGMQKNGLAYDVIRSEPQRLREIPLSAS